ncbi:hypothetical protein DFH08DRAFT_882051 [Mycena albidolilacea]|uniref:DUF6534 domain-containing protein n=1 Tax=Mycena albidolilacea TaxID=1033008 RepID=A0AAD6ZNH1_9AGAR|nr:hypothetical protein DFH08DRAFT_882051 [Mycena albidolilacea]
MATLDNTFGVLYQTVVISAALYGAGSLQAWYYFRKYPSDLCWMKFLVAFVIVCDTCQQALTTASVYSYLVTNFGNPAIRHHLFNTLIIQIFFKDLIAVPVQLFYAHRVYRLSDGNWIISGFLAMLSLGTCAAYFVKSIEALPLSAIAELASLKTLTIACNIAAAVTNVLISVFLVYHLYILKRGDSRTDDIINRLIAFAFNTGLPTSLCSVAACIAMTVAPQTFIYMFWTIIQGRFYTNSLLVTLNTRNYVRSVIAPSTEPETELTESVRYPSTLLYSTYRPEESNALSVRIDARGVARSEEDFIQAQSKSKQSAVRQ